MWGRQRIAALLLLALICPRLQAAPTTRFTVGATVRAGCMITTARPADTAFIGLLGTLDFGRDAALSKATHATRLADNAGFSLSCTPGIPLSMSVDGGQHFAGTRAMQQEGGHATLAYGLYRDANFSSPIGVNQPFALDTRGTSRRITLPLHARLTLPGDLPAGRYRDTLTITLQW